MGRGTTFDYDGKSLTLRQWAAEFGVSYFDICRARMHGLSLADIAGGKRAGSKHSTGIHPRWTDDDLETLRTMHAAGASYVNIARTLGRTAPAVRTRVKLLGL